MMRRPCATLRARSLPGQCSAIMLSGISAGPLDNLFFSSLVFVLAGSSGPAST
jgi:hypothetical protein